MTLYAAFDELLSKHSAEILDDPSRCKAEFRRMGFEEEILEVRLFFLLLDKHIILEVQKLAFKQKNKTNYALSVILYIKLFAQESLSNEHETILLKHIQLIIEVLQNKHIVQFEYAGTPEVEFVTELGAVLEKIIGRYGSSIFAKPAWLRAVIQDLSGNSVSAVQVAELCQTLEALNDGKLQQTNQKNDKYLKLLATALKRNN